MFLLLTKSFVGAYTRGGRIVRGYVDKRTKHEDPQDGQGELFAERPSAPAREDIDAALRAHRPDAAMLASLPPVPGPPAGKPEDVSGIWSVITLGGRTADALNVELEEGFVDDSDPGRIALRAALKGGKLNLPRDVAARRLIYSTLVSLSNTADAKAYDSGGKGTPDDKKDAKAFSELAAKVAKDIPAGNPEPRIVLPTAPPAEFIPDGHTRKHYVTMVREPGTPGQKIAWLAGPFDTNEEAKAHVAPARKKASEVDAFSDFDAFGTSSRVAAVHRPGVLNGHLGLS